MRARHVPRRPPGAPTIGARPRAPWRARHSRSRRDGEVGDEADRPPNREPWSETTARKPNVSGKFDDPQLAMRVGPELRRIVGQRLLHGIDHAAARSRRARDGDRRRARRRSRGRARPRSGPTPPTRNSGSGVSIAVAKEPPPIVAPFALEIARCERDLVGAGRDRDGETDEIGVGVDEVAPALRLVVRLGERLEPMARRRASAADIALHADRRREIGVVRECAVVEDGSSPALEAARASDAVKVSVRVSPGAIGVRGRNTKWLKRGCASTKSASGSSTWSIGTCRTSQGRFRSASARLTRVIAAARAEGTPVADRGRPPSRSR